MAAGVEGMTSAYDSSLDGLDYIVKTSGLPVVFASNQFEFAALFGHYF